MILRVVKGVLGSSLLRSVFFMHWTTELEGGISTLEKRALQELGLSVGAREVFIIDAPAPLTDEALFTL